MELLTVFIQGFFVCAGLIIAIGAQNAYVLKQGILRRQLFITAFVSSLGDIVLIAMGIGGLGAVLGTHPELAKAAGWGGIIFLSWFAVKSFHAAYKGGALTVTAGESSPQSKTAAVAAAIGFSLLNPHAWIDTVLLIGGIAAPMPSAHRITFGVGAVMASIVWFFGVTYSAVRLAPLFAKPVSWRILDTFIGCVMVAVAFSLLKTVL